MCASYQVAGDRWVYALLQSKGLRVDLRGKTALVFGNPYARMRLLSSSLGGDYGSKLKLLNWPQTPRT